MEKRKELALYRVWLLLPALSFVFLAAHELRTGDLFHLAGWLGAALLMLTLRRTWVRHVCLLALCLGLVTWIQVTVELLRFRIFAHQSYTLLVVIMGSVASLMIVSILILFSKSMQTWFEGRREKPGNTE